MSENNSKSTHNDYCNFCGNKITAELSKKIKANKENVVCELCGCQLLLITNTSKEQNRGTELITDIEKEHQEEIREELKELYSLNIYSADREKFGYYLTIFMSRSIYNIIKQYNLGINITDIHIEMISNSIMIEIINNRVNNKWLAEFKPIKKNFKKCYRELQSELSLNQALQEVFLEFFRLLAKIIIKLINKKDYSELQGIEYDIAEYLIKRDLFVSNIRFTVPFRYNLKICLSRLIYLRIKDIACKNNLKFRQLKLSNIENRNISDEIIKYLTTHNEIINKFLGELEGIKLDDFNEFYEYLCLELKSDSLFAESFNYYLRWLIGHIHEIICGEYKWKELSHFDRIIATKLAQLTNVEVDFEKIREFKKKVQNTFEIAHENPINPEVNELSADKKQVDGLLQNITLYNFKAIKLIFSLYFYEILTVGDAESVDHTVHRLKESVLGNINLPKKLTDKNILKLHGLASNYPDVFVKYFSDLFHIVKYIINLSILFRKIGATIKIMPIIEMLEKKDITLFQGHYGFHHSVIEIYDFLNENYPNFFPNRMRIMNTPIKERSKIQRQIKRIVGTKIKLYVIKHIYNGKYFKNGRVICPECLKEGINSSVLRIKALEFHHTTDKKENEFTSDNLYKIFIKNELNPHFLEDLILLMESEKVELLNTNHHNVFHYKNYRYFRYLINLDDLFSYPAEVIHMLIKVSVNNFYKTKDLSFEDKREIRRHIIMKIKKRYIIETLYGISCPTCGKFNTKDHLTAYNFNHKDPNTKRMDIYTLFRNTSCSKIVEILERENGGFLCGNCHTVIHFEKYTPILEEIFEDKSTVNEILDDYNKVRENFYLINNKNSIEDLFKMSKNFYDSSYKYLMAISDISNSGHKVTYSTLSNYLGLAKSSVYSFFKRPNLVNKYLDIELGKSGWDGKKTVYSLNEKGRELVSLLNHFRDYFGSTE